ncbi:MAG: glutamate--tRNA ligase, partial [Mariprofundaceae bacterium]|nr:glutamate--tRNA ligase [Mariprofundaceae bacterium]
ALVQALVRLGHPNMPDDALSPEALAWCFDAAHISTAAVKWSDADMWRWHARLLHAMAPEELAPLIRPHVPETDDARLRAFAALISGNLQRVEDAAGFIRLLDVQAEIGEDAADVIRRAGTDFFNAALASWQELAAADWQAWTQAIKAKTGHTGKALFLPLRAALTGVLHGPEMSAVVGFLGRDGVSARLEHVKGWLNA